MSGFDLVPVDGGAPVHLPPGETVLGRGPMLGVSDRRISRHHALLQNQDGNLQVKPTHLNPCFVQSSLTDDPRPLLRDSWWPLQDGDLFSLLPGHLVYRVVAVGGAARTARNGQTCEEEKGKQEEEELPLSSKPEVEPSQPIRADREQTPPHEESPVTAVSEEEQSLNNKEAEAATKEVDVGGGGGDPPVTRTRVLPAWMMVAVTTPHGSSPTSRVESLKRPTASKQATPTATYSPQEAELSGEEQRPRKRRRKEERGGATPTTAFDSASTTSITQAPDISDSEENRKSRTDRDSASSVPAPSRRPVRMPCPYGRDCYRKNPVHFQECSHPGDTDYEEEEEEDEAAAAGAERPECPYGTDCYRKNPLHRKEFKHTKKPARATRTVPEKSPAHDDDDSFINDDSEDMGDDSDYVPPDSEDSGKEDIKRLHKEAQAFLRKRK